MTPMPVIFFLIKKNVYNKIFVNLFKNFPKKHAWIEFIVTVQNHWPTKHAYKFLTML